MVPFSLTPIVAVNKGHFEFHYVIGKGGFGKVWRVERKKDRAQYAMKEMTKARILAKRSVNSVLNERRILTMLRHSYGPASLLQLHRQHGLLFPRQGDALSRHGPDVGWRFALPHQSQAAL